MGTPENRTCGTCRFRGVEDHEHAHLIPSGYFLCTLIKHQEVRYSQPVAPGAGGFVIDGSDYYAALCVEADFGCNKWEAAK